MLTAHARHRRRAGCGSWPSAPGQRVQGFRFRVLGLGFRVYGVWGLGFRV